MSIENKRALLRAYCRRTGIKPNCDGCNLKYRNWKNPTCFECLDIYESDEEDINKALELIGESNDLDKAHNTEFLDKKFNIPLKDNVNSPSHYTDGKIEVIDYIEDKKLGFCLGNAIKYISRAGKKDKDKEAEDIKKAIWYLNRYLKRLEEA